MMRLAAFPAPTGATLKAGIYACCPTGAGMAAVFTSFTLRRPYAGEQLYA
jgi:regulation of enolase protein 1 (concanavalin A-like superfamily)